MKNLELEHSDVRLSFSRFLRLSFEVHLINRYPIPKALVLCIVCLLPGVALADEMQGIRAMGMADALRAAPTGAAALALNPAGMSLVNMYDIDAAYQYHVRRRGHMAHVSVVDSITTKKVAAGVYYNFFHFSPQVFEPTLNRKIRLSTQGHQTGLAVSVPFGSRFILGANVGYIFHKTTSTIFDSELGEEREYEVEKLNTVGVDVGIIFKAVESTIHQLNIGLVGKNLVPTDSLSQPLTLGIGAAYGYKRVILVDVDVVLDFEVPKKDRMVQIHGGVEGFVAGKFALRGGAKHLAYWNATFVTAGFGYVNPKVALELGFGQQVSGGVESQIGLSIRFFLN